MTVVGTMSKYQYILKNVYLPKIVDQYNKETPFLNRIESKKSPTQTLPSGNGWVQSIASTGHSGVDVAADSGALPTAGARNIENATWYAKYNYGVMDISGPTLKNIENKQASFSESGLTGEMKALVSSVRMETERKFAGSGMGKLANWESGASGVYVLTGPTKSNYSTYGFGGTSGTKFIQNGISLNVIDFAAGTSMTKATTTYAAGVVTARTSTGCTVTDPSINEAAGDFLTRYSALDASTVTAPVPSEPWGIFAIASAVDADDIISYGGSTGVTTGTSCTVGGIAVSTDSNWAGQIGYNAGSSRWATPAGIDLDLMNSFIYEMQGASGVKPTVAYLTPKLFGLIMNKLVADKRYAGGEQELKGGASGFTYSGVDFIPLFSAQEGTIVFIHEPDLIYFKMSDHDWMDKGGSIFQPQSGYDAYTLVLYHYGQLGCAEEIRTVFTSIATSLRPNLIN